MPATDGVDRQRVRLLAILAQSADEDAGRVQLVAAQFGHQSTTGAFPQAPTAQFRHGIDLRRVVQLETFIAEVLGLQFAIRVPGGPLSQLAF